MSENNKFEARQEFADELKTEELFNVSGGEVKSRTGWTCRHCQRTNNLFAVTCIFCKQKRYYK